MCPTPYTEWVKDEIFRCYGFRIVMVWKRIVLLNIFMNTGITLMVRSYIYSYIQLYLTIGPTDISFSLQSERKYFHFSVEIK